MNIKEADLYGTNRTQFEDIFAQKTSDIVLAHCLEIMCKEQGQKWRKNALTSDGKLKKQMKTDELTQLRYIHGFS